MLCMALFGHVRARAYPDEIDTTGAKDVGKR
jgi:hypothetical protein